MPIEFTSPLYKEHLTDDVVNQQIPYLWQIYWWDFLKCFWETAVESEQIAFSKAENMPEGVWFKVLSINDLPVLRETTCLLYNRDNFMELWIVCQLKFSAWEIFQKFFPMGTVIEVFISQNDFLFYFYVTPTSSVLFPSGFQLSLFYCTIIPLFCLTLFSLGLFTYLDSLFRLVINRLWKLELATDAPP